MFVGGQMDKETMAWKIYITKKIKKYIYHNVIILSLTRTSSYQFL